VAVAIVERASSTTRASIMVVCDAMVFDYTIVQIVRSNCCLDEGDGQELIIRVVFIATYTMMEFWPLLN
jgi:hypothetical protein